MRAFKLQFFSAFKAKLSSFSIFELTLWTLHFIPRKDKAQFLVENTKIGTIVREQNQAESSGEKNSEL
jgi:hypothetical protein